MRDFSAPSNLNHLLYSFSFCLLVVVLLSTLLRLSVFASRNLFTLDCLSTLHAANSKKHCRTNAPSHVFGVVAKKQGDDEIAEQYLLRAVLSYHHPIAFQELASLWMEQGDWEKILGILRAMPIDEHLFIYLAEMNLSTDRTKLDQWLQIVNMRFPTNQMMQAQLLMYAGEYVRAERMLCYPTNPWNDFERQRLLGMSLFYQRKYEEAIPVFASLYNRQVDSADVAYWYGRSLRYNGQSQASIQPLKRAADTESGWIKIIYQLELASAYAALEDCENLRITLQAIKDNRSNSAQETEHWIQSLDSTVEQICTMRSK